MSKFQLGPKSTGEMKRRTKLAEDVPEPVEDKHGVQREGDGEVVVEGWGLLELKFGQ